MPKIFLIKDRLQQQQAKLQEAVKAGLLDSESYKDERTSLDLRKSKIDDSKTWDLSKSRSSHTRSSSIDGVTLDLSTSGRNRRDSSLERVPLKQNLYPSQDDQPLSLTKKDQDRGMFF